MAEEPSDFVGFVVVVNVPALLPTWLVGFTDRATAALAGEYLLEALSGPPVKPPDARSPLHFSVLLCFSVVGHVIGVLL